MDKEYLIKMIDGGITNVYTDSYCAYSGCPTCNYRSRYVREIILYLDGFNIEVNMEDMFSAPYSEGDLMKLLCSNNDEIKQMTQDEFYLWFKEEISKEEEHLEYGMSIRKSVDI